MSGRRSRPECSRSGGGGGERERRLRKLSASPPASPPRLPPAWKPLSGAPPTPSSPPLDGTAAPARRRWRQPGAPGLEGGGEPRPECLAGAVPSPMRLRRPWQRLGGQERLRAESQDSRPKYPCSQKTESLCDLLVCPVNLWKKRSFHWFLVIV
ncbi:translation initiation factor IF-2-like isoform X2 [Sphaerodactylus townsendi]|uniref:translation initiation factor IF-2-like isoform X2 n=1 Tax=Sphaerodactylus townsendi TaxID=933632 RepID=UPI0020274CD6|nr:translation initiation factor IF-2-like isoform X2 [Sphaerodactylus townsendi]